MGRIWRERKTVAIRSAPDDAGGRRVRSVEERPEDGTTDEITVAQVERLSEILEAYVD